MYTNSMIKLIFSKKEKNIKKLYENKQKNLI